VVSTCEVPVICSTEYEQSDWESTRRSFQSVRSYKEIRGAFDSKVDWHPQRSISTTVNGDCSTSHLRQRPAYGTGWQRSKQWSTSQHLTDGWSRLKTEVYEVVSAQLLALVHLLSLA